MKMRDLLKVAATVVAVLIVWTFGLAAIGWVWDRGVVPVARAIAGADTPPADAPRIVVGVVPEADVPQLATGELTAPEADEAEVVSNTASGDVPEAPAAICTVQGIAVTDGNNGLNAAPISGAFEPCYVIVQVHGTDGKGYVMVLAPTQWLRLTAKGAAGWYVMPANVEAEIANSVASIEARGEATPTVVRFDLGDPADSMPGIVAGPYTGPLAP